MRGYRLIRRDERGLDLRALHWQEGVYGCVVRARDGVLPPADPAPCTHIGSRTRARARACIPTHPRAPPCCLTTQHGHTHARTSLWASARRRGTRITKGRGCSLIWACAVRRAAPMTPRSRCAGGSQLGCKWVAGTCVAQHCELVFYEAECGAHPDGCASYVGEGQSSEPGGCYSSCENFQDASECAASPRAAHSSMANALDSE